MRLTFRTLLAYLDDTLEPARAKEIGQKLAESPAAQELVNRIREVTRRRRLTAPHLSGDRLDPNELAEYLDNLLAPEAVAEVEQVCLESDIHLAEAAACHQILTLIGQPAHVTDATRQRMYELVHEIESLPADRRPKRREPRTQPAASVFARRPLLARVLSIVAGIIGIVVIALLAWISLNPQRTGPDTSRVAQAPARPDGHFKVHEQPVDMPQPLVPEFPEAAPLIQPDVEMPPELRDRAALPPRIPAEPGEMPAEPAKAEPEMPGEAGRPPAAPAAEPVEAPPRPGPTPAEAPAAEPLIPIGVYASTSGVLMRYDREHHDWRRLALRSDVATGQPLLCLPTYRAMIQTPGGASLELVGAATAPLETPRHQWETELAFLLPEEGIDARVQLERGRVVLGTSAAEGTFQIEFLDSQQRQQSWTITLKGPEMVVGVLLGRPWRPGGSSVSEAVVLLPRGEAEFRTADRVDRLGGPVQLRWNAAEGFSERESLTTPPAWLEREEMGMLMARASEQLSAERTLPVDASAILPLVEAARSDRSKELRMLAVQCLGAVGRLPALIDALRATERRDTRLEAIKALRLYMARGPAEEEALAQSLQTKMNDPVVAEAALGLLRGFSDSEFKDRETYDALITLLGSSELAIRELAIRNLEELAGRLPSANYSPDKPSTNEAAVAAWRRALEERRLPPRERGKM
jgi:hypothetical protein